MRRRRARWDRGLRAAAAIAALPVATGGCLSPTEITLDVTSDLPCSKVDTVAITAGPEGTVEARNAPGAIGQCTDRDGGGHFGTLALTPSGSVDDEITVRAVAGVLPTHTASCKDEDSYAGCIVVRRELHYELHSPLTLPIDLHADCLGATCDGEGSTCVDGACLPSKIADPSRCTGDGCSQAKLFAGQMAPSCLGDRDFAGLGTLTHTSNSLFGALSADGRVVFAFSSDLADRTDATAFRCAQPNERATLIGPRGRSMIPNASDDTGAGMAGSDFLSAQVSGPVRWTEETSEQLTGVGSSQVLGCDRQTCSVLVGGNEQVPLFWRSPTAKPVVLTASDHRFVHKGQAYAVDPSGRFAVGVLLSAASIWDLSTDPPRWRGIGLGLNSSGAFGATPDGLTIVGQVLHGGGSGTRGEVWKAKKAWVRYEPQTLEALSGTSQCAAVSISDDGTIIGGWCGQSPQTAVIWDARTGSAPKLVRDRIDAPSGWTLINTYLSADGTIVAGDAFNPRGDREAYIGRLK